MRALRVLEIWNLFEMLNSECWMLSIGSFRIAISTSFRPHFVFHFTCTCSARIFFEVVRSHTLHSIYRCNMKAFWDFWGKSFGTRIFFLNLIHVTLECLLCVYLCLPHLLGEVKVVWGGRFRRWFKGRFGCQFRGSESTQNPSNPESIWIAVATPEEQQHQNRDSNRFVIRARVFRPRIHFDQSHRPKIELGWSNLGRFKGDWIDLWITFWINLFRQLWLPLLSLQPHYLISGDQLTEGRKSRHSFDLNWSHQYYDHQSPFHTCCAQI
jgi:hypothetical protein